MRKSCQYGKKIRTGIIKYWFGRSLLTLFGWHVEGEIPHTGKYILIGAPHTSNWDLPLAIAASFVCRTKIHWLGKAALFHWPYGWFMRMLGGIAIDRSRPHGMVEQLKSLLDECDNLVVVVAAKGTRKKTQYWKSGFYWIAYTAQIPVLCSFFDYRNKRVNIGLALMLSGNVKADMDIIRDYFKEMSGLRPECEDIIRLKEED